jgi:signal transduction histidine kinase
LCTSIWRSFSNAQFFSNAMKNKGKFADLPVAEQQSLLESVRRIRVFEDLKEDTIECLQRAELIEADAGDRILQQGELAHAFWIFLEGAMRVESVGPDGMRRTLAIHRGSETFGEMPLLAGSPNRTDCVISQPSRLLSLDEDSFWHLMKTCPNVRKGILANMALRLEGLQSLVMQREKLASLGTMAAGLMHELNNPGSAAQRAAAHLREDLTRLQELNLRNCRMGFDAEELNCIADLQEYILQPRKLAASSSLDQADAEEALTQWLEEAGVKDAWKLAPPLVGIGLTAEKLECARSSFRPEALSGALDWVEALVSSVQQLETIEESITRVTELVSAVKRYSYAEKSCQTTIDLHESLQSALIILGHKIRQKEINVSKEFSPNLPPLQLKASGLSQVWTNLLDNAIDAAPEQGHIIVRTWTEDSDVFVGIRDDGPGIPEQHQAHIFEPFFTSKAVGVGTGLGLSIAYKIITAHFDGEIRFESQPGNTEFIVRLPLQACAVTPNKV